MINRHKQQSEFQVFFQLHSKDKRQVIQTEYYTYCKLLTRIYHKVQC